MRLAVISDIHGNIEALRQVLGDMGGQDAAAVVSLGDNVGYGPRPEEVVSVLRDLSLPSVRGNHEAALAEPFRQAWFNPLAARALTLTRGLLSPKNLAWSAALPDCLVRFGMRFVHGAPPDDTSTYLCELDDEALVDLFATFDERICFAGHTHSLGVLTLTGDGVLCRPLVCDQKIRLEPDLRHIVVCGSVGQPRDRDARAKYVIFDDREGLLITRGVPYDTSRTAREIRARGIPEIFALRLLGSM